MKYVATQMLPSQKAPPDVRRLWTPARIWGRVFLAIWIVAIVSIVYWLYAEWDAEKVAQYAPRYFNGLGVTLLLVAISIIAGALLSLPIAYARMSTNKLLRSGSFAYVYLFRGTPLLAQLFLIYYGFGTFRPQLEAIGLWVFFRDAWNCALFAFTLNTAAYQAEILRGAIQSVPKGQHEGAAALGIPKPVAFFKIIFPQALIVALRPYGNEIVLMIKGSAIVALVTVFDLMGEARRVFSRTYDFQALIWAAVFYLVIVETLRNIWEWLEKRLTRHLKR